MISLLKTYLDVIFLRRGPDAVPHSWLVLYLSLAILGASWFLQMFLLSAPDGSSMPAFIAYLAALSFYAVIVITLGFHARLLQMMSTLIACGSLIAITAAATAVLLSALTGPVAANAIGALIWLWSVPVKGHIVATTVQKHWLFGIAIAMLAYLLRFAVESSFVVREPPGGVS